MGFEPPIVALAVASAPPARLPEAVAIADPDFDWLHVDVADGHLVPRLTYGAPMLELLRRFSLAPFDAHLLSTNPLPLVEPLRTAGADVITVHASACPSPRSVLQAIRGRGARAGLALGSDESVASVRRLLPEVDVLLIPTAPVHSVGDFQAEAIARVQEAREHREREGLPYLIEVEGGITLAHVTGLREAGADIYVIGRPILQAGDPRLTLAMFRASCRGRTLDEVPDGVTPAAPAAPARIVYLTKRRRIG